MMQHIYANRILGVPSDPISTPGRQMNKDTGKPWYPPLYPHTAKSTDGVSTGYMACGQAAQIDTERMYLPLAMRFRL